jgi:hypothetical protein
MDKTRPRRALGIDLNRLLEAPCASLVADDLLGQLEESHLVIWAKERALVEHACALCRDALGSIPETQVVELDGRRMTDLGSARQVLDAALPAPAGQALRPSFDGPAGILARLREPPASLGRTHVKRRYYLWTDADTLLASSPACFSVLVDAIAGVAAEGEYASDDLLLIQRLVVVGGPELAICHANAHGPLRTWRQTSPWARLTHVPRPVFTALRAR